jgi:hypothetical protein
MSFGQREEKGTGRKPRESAIGGGRVLATAHLKRGFRNKTGPKGCYPTAQANGLGIRPNRNAALKGADYRPPKRLFRPIRAKDHGWSLFGRNLARPVPGYKSRNGVSQPDWTIERA